MRKTVFVILLSLFLFSYCGIDTGDQNDTSGTWQKVSGDNITLSGDLSAPKIDWEGGSATSLNIADDNYDEVWSIGSGDLTSSKTFDPPVSYGKAPDGIQENGSAQDLKKGVEYTIVINIPSSTSSKTSLTAVWIFK